MGLCRRIENSETRTIIAVQGWIGGTNAAEFGQEIDRIMMGMNPEKLIIDADELEYISSAGLRELMKLRKRISNIIVRNVSPEVYDIFEVTGFKEVLQVEKKIREISLDGCPLVSEGTFGKIYRLDNDKIVKMYRPDMPKEYIHSERVMAQKAFIMGVPTAISYDVVRCGDSFGVVFEMFKAETLAGIIRKDPASAAEYGRKCAALLKELHEIEPEKGDLPDCREKFLGWTESMKQYLDASEISLMENYLNENIPDKQVFLHGDFHCKNIMEVDGELMLIDIGDASMGDPAFDLGQIMFSQIIIPKTTKTPEQAEMLLGFSADIARKFSGELISAYFGTTDHDKLADITAKLDPVAKFCLGKYATSYTAGNEDATANIVEKLIRGSLIPALKNAPKVDF